MYESHVKVMISRTCQRSLDARQNFNFGEMSPISGFSPRTNFEDMSTISRCTQQYSFRGDVPISGYTPKKKSTTLPKARTWPSRKWRQAPPFKFPRFWLPGPVLWTDAVERTVSVNGWNKNRPCNARKPTESRISNWQSPGLSLATCEHQHVCNQL